MHAGAPFYRYVGPGDQGELATPFGALMSDTLPVWTRLARSHAAVLARPLVEAVVTMLAALATRSL